MKFLAPILADQRTIFAIVGLLAIWAILSAVRLYSRTGILIATLPRALALVDAAADPRAFAESFETTAQQLAGLGPLGAAWSAYRVTLIVPDGGVPSRLVRSTLRPDQVFDLGLLRVTGVRPRYHAAMPGMLVGAGLLFTFWA